MPTNGGRIVTLMALLTRSHSTAIVTLARVARTFTAAVHLATVRTRLNGLVRVVARAAVVVCRRISRTSLGRRPR